MNLDQSTSLIVFCIFNYNYHHLYFGKSDIILPVELSIYISTIIPEGVCPLKIFLVPLTNCPELYASLIESTIFCVAYD